MRLYLLPLEQQVANTVDLSATTIELHLPQPKLEDVVVPLLLTRGVFKL